MASVGSIQPPVPGGLPAGGTQGQILFQDTSGNLTWQQQPGVPDVLITSGKWLDSRSTAGLVTQTLSIAVGSVYFVAMWLPKAVAINQIAVRMPTVNTGNLGAAVYSNSATNSPGSVLFSGTTNVSTGVSVTVNVTVAGSMPAGWSWVGVGMSTTSGGTSSFAAADYVTQRFPFQQLSTTLSQTYTAVFRWSAYTGTFIDNPQMSTQNTAFPPVVWLRMV